MSLWAQIAAGTLVLGLCATVHLGLIILSLRPLAHLNSAVQHRFTLRQMALLIGTGFALIVLGHTIQVWIWAFSFLLLGGFATIEPAIYFALASFTTLGYGDVVLGPELRIFGAFASVTGMLTFGVSTAFLVGLIGRALPRGRR